MDTIYDKLKEYSMTDAYPFHMPGHKRQLFGDILSEISQIDITEIDGFDDLYEPKGILKEAQDKTSDLYGSEESFFLVNGSTCGILCAIAACVPKGGWLMMARNCHKSVYHAALLGGLKTVYVYPGEEKGFSFCKGLEVRQIESALKDFSEMHPGEKISALVLTSPTYEGVLSDVDQIAKFLHEKEIPLIVDEAHGAHLGLAHGIPENSCRAGADLVIHSLHKTLPAMTQTALLHVNGGLVNKDRLRRFLSIYQTSSPSYVLMASIDRAVTMMRENGEEYFRSFLKRRRDLMNVLQGCKRLCVYQEEGTDPCKLVVSTKGTKLTGKMLYDELRLGYGLQLEMAAGDYVVAILTVMDTEEGFQRLAQAVLEIDARTEESRLPEGAGESRLSQEDGSLKIPEASIIYTLEKASVEETHIWMPYDQAKGKISGGFVFVYPPGIPILAPGERILPEHIQSLNRLQKQGLSIKGLSGSEIAVLNSNIF